MFTHSHSHTCNVASFYLFKRNTFCIFLPLFGMLWVKRQQNTSNMTLKKNLGSEVSHYSPLLREVCISFEIRCKKSHPSAYTRPSHKVNRKETQTNLFPPSVKQRCWENSLGRFCFFGYECLTVSMKIFKMYHQVKKKTFANIFVKQNFKRRQVMQQDILLIKVISVESDTCWNGVKKRCQR